MRMMLTALAVLVVWAGGARAEVSIVVNKNDQRMTVSVDGFAAHYWKVSTGLGGGPYNGNFKPQRLERQWYSRTFNMAPMPHAIFFDGPYAIHGTNYVNKLGQRASKGCVRLHPSDAKTLFDLVTKHGMANTRITVEPGGAPKIVSR